jgi:hypothetical protein
LSASYGAETDLKNRLQKKSSHNLAYYSCNRLIGVAPSDKDPKNAVCSIL